MKKLIVTSVILALSFFRTSLANSTDLSPWNYHAAPFTFQFGNDFDSHQQTRQIEAGGLFGFFYIGFTGGVTKDGYRVATHVDCNAMPCTVGWILEGKRREAIFQYEVAPDHPVFLVHRPDIPEPGAYAHFHWLGANPQPGESKSGYLLQLTAVDTFCFIHDGADSARRKNTCRDNGGVPVHPGIDIATHLNIVTSVPK